MARPIVTIHIAPDFEKALLRLPERVRELATRKDQWFRKDAFDPRLRTHKLKGKLSEYWSYSVNREYRVSPLTETDPFSLMETDPVVAAGFSAELGYRKVFARANVHARKHGCFPRRRRKHETFRIRAGDREPRNSRGLRSHGRGTREMADNGEPSHAQVIARRARFLFLRSNRGPRYSEISVFPRVKYH